MLEGRFGVAATFLVPMITAGSDDFNTTWTPAAGDVKISKDGGAFSNITSLPTLVGSMWAFALSATEQEAKVVTVQIIDSATKAIKDNAFIVNNMPHGALSTGKLQSGSANTAQLAAGETYGADNVISGAVFESHGGTGRGQSAAILSYVDATDTATLDRSVTTAFGAGTLYTLWPAPAAPSNPTAYPSVNVEYWKGAALVAPDTAGYPKVTIKVGAGTGELSLTAGLVSINTTVSLKKNVAKNNFMFLVTDSTNHNPVTGRVITLTRSIDGAAFAAGTLGAITEVSSGWYKTNIPAADLNGDVIALRGTATGMDDFNVVIFTQS